MSLSRSTLWPAAAFCLGISAIAQTSLQGPAGQDPSEYILSTGVDLVALSVAVSDDKGRHIPGLVEGNFRVVENGRLQEITLFAEDELPITLGLVIDRSSSMQSKRPALLHAVESFLRQRRPDDEMFLVMFNEKVSLGLPESTPFTHEADVLLSSLRHTPAIGRTGLYDAVMTGVKYLDSGSHSRKALLVFSDGADNASTHRLADAILAVQRSSAIVYTVGLFHALDEDRNPRVLKQLAKGSGGLAFLSRNASTLSDVCLTIAHDLRNRYVIGYSPANRAFDGKFRKVEVAVSAPGQGKVQARSRPGYWSPLPVVPANLQSQ